MLNIDSNQNKRCIVSGGDPAISSQTHPTTSHPSAPWHPCSYPHRHFRPSTRAARMPPRINQERPVNPALFNILPPPAPKSSDSISLVDNITLRTGTMLTRVERIKPKLLCRPPVMIIVMVVVLHIFTFARENTAKANFPLRSRTTMTVGADDADNSLLRPPLINQSQVDISSLARDACPARNNWAEGARWAPPGPSSSRGCHNHRHRLWSDC